MINLSRIIKVATPAWICSVGVAIIGYLAFRVVKWIICKCEKTERIDQLANAVLPKSQPCARGYLAKLKADKLRGRFLSAALFEKAKTFVDPPANLSDLPRASACKTPVYFPHDLPVVLKQSGAVKAQERFEKMWQARDICEKNGYSHLVLSIARLYGDFIIENKLPITFQSTKEQIGLYVENHDKFTRAVEEFTRLLFQSDFYDITEYYGWAETVMGRYDNVSLYLEENRGRIGLLDLECFSPASNHSARSMEVYILN